MDNNGREIIMSTCVYVCVRACMCDEISFNDDESKILSTIYFTRKILSDLIKNKNAYTAESF